MIAARFQTTTRLALAAMAFAVVALGIAIAPSADAAGLRSCPDVTGPQSGRVGCYEDVWADGVQYRMTFSNTRFSGAAPNDLDGFYVIAPQTDKPQGAPPATFPHDHVVRDIPHENHGTYSVKLHGFFVLCSGQGILSGACVPAWTPVGGDTLPFAKSADGRPLTDTGAIESAARAGDVALINLGPGAVIIGSVNSPD